MTNRPDTDKSPIMDSAVCGTNWLAEVATTLEKSYRLGEWNACNGKPMMTSTIFHDTYFSKEEWQILNVELQFTKAELHQAYASGYRNFIAKKESK